MLGIRARAHLVLLLSILTIATLGGNAHAVLVIPTVTNGNSVVQRVTNGPNELKFYVGFRNRDAVSLDVILGANDNPFAPVSLHSNFTNLGIAGWKQLSVVIVGGPSLVSIGDTLGAASVDTSEQGEVATFGFGQSSGLRVDVLFGATIPWLINTNGSSSFSINVQPLASSGATVPEPATWILVLLALICVVGTRVPVGRRTRSA